MVKKISYLITDLYSRDLSGGVIKLIVVGNETSTSFVISVLR